MPRPQFSLKTMLWLAFSAAMFMGGMAVQRHLDKPRIETYRDPEGYEHRSMEMPDGTRWFWTSLWTQGANDAETLLEPDIFQNDDGSEPPPPSD